MNFHNTYPALVSACRLLPWAAWFLTLTMITGCSMKEEIRRIEAVKQARQANESLRSTNLTGEQLYIRSCNTCHPGARKGMGPSLIETNEHFKTDVELAAFLRKGKGLMPAQTAAVMNDREMSNLVEYVRKVSGDLKEQSGH
jgi:mono/diheme cytochrome c family protein